MEKLPHKHKGGEVAEFTASSEAVLQAERALAQAKGEQYAVPAEFPVRWDAGAPMPHLLKNDGRTFLLFFLPELEPTKDESYLRMAVPDEPMAEKIAVVEFERCVCMKMGTPNDEVLGGHPLYGKGLTFYRGFRSQIQPG
jgi:hypothetical protein